MFSVCRQYTTCSEHARATDRQIARKKERRTSSREWTKIMTVNLPRRNFWKVAFKTRNFQKCWPLNFRVSYLGSDDDTPTETNFNYIYPSVPIVLYYIPYNIIIEHDNRCDCQQKYRRKIGVFPRCLTFDSNRQISSPPFPIHPNFNSPIRTFTRENYYKSMLNGEKKERKEIIGRRRQVYFVLSTNVEFRDILVGSRSHRVWSSTDASTQQVPKNWRLR